MSSNMKAMAKRRTIEELSKCKPIWSAIVADPLASAAAQGKITKLNPIGSPTISSRKRRGDKEIPKDGASFPLLQRYKRRVKAITATDRIINAKPSIMPTGYAPR